MFQVAENVAADQYCVAYVQFCKTNQVVLTNCMKTCRVCNCLPCSNHIDISVNQRNNFGNNIDSNVGDNTETISNHWNQNIAINIGNDSGTISNNQCNIISWYVNLSSNNIGGNKGEN